jgi:hypothetical protein
MLVPDSGAQPDSHAVDAGQACVEDSILLARMRVGNEARGCGVDGLQRARGGEVVGTILEPHHQASSRSFEDDASTIAVVGELEGCWFQVDAWATQHCDKLGDEVGVDSTRRRESRFGGQGDAVLPARRRRVAAALDHEVQEHEDQGQPNNRETDIHHVPPRSGGLVLNITWIRCGSARRPPKLSARALALRLRSEASVAIERAPRCPPATLLRSQDTSNTFLELGGRVGVVAEWSFLTNHARVMLCIAQDPDARLRDIASELGITERSAYGIVTDLADAEYVVKERDGRRNRYQIQHHLPLREATNRERTIGEMLDLLGSTNGRKRRGSRKRSTRL